MRKLSTKEIELVSGGLETIIVRGTRPPAYDPWDHWWDDHYDDHYDDEDGGNSDGGSSNDFDASGDETPEQVMQQILNGEIQDIEQLEEILSEMTAEDLKQLDNFITGLQAYADRNIAIIEEMGGTATQFLDGFEKLSKGLGTVGAIIDIVSIGNDLSDGQFTIEEQGDAFAAVGAAAAAYFGVPGAIASVIIASFGDEAYEILAPIMIEAAETLNQVASDLDAAAAAAIQDFLEANERFLEEIPTDDTTGTIDIPGIFMPDRGYDDFWDPDRQPL